MNLIARLQEVDSNRNVIRVGPLSPQYRVALVIPTRDGSAEHRLTHRAKAVLLLHERSKCEEVARVPDLDGDTLLGWPKSYGEGGAEGQTRIKSGGSSAGRLSPVREEALKA